MGRSRVREPDEQEDLELLLVLLATAASLWVFLGLATAVDGGSTQRVDEAILRVLRARTDGTGPAGASIAVELARDVTALGSVPVLVLVTAAVAGFLALARLPRALVLLLAASLGGTGWTFLLKELFARPRPLVRPDVVPSPTSFPSGHAALAAVIYLTLAVLLARLVSRRSLRAYVIAVAALLVALVGLSRIALGVHYPSDVAAGWTLGLSWALFCWTTTAVLQRRGALGAGAAPGR